MTSDAKIGLLLGLVFIFVIAFVINGLPSLRPPVTAGKVTTVSADEEFRDVTGKTDQAASSWNDLLDQQKTNGALTPTPAETPKAVVQDAPASPPAEVPSLPAPPPQTPGNEGVRFSRSLENLLNQLTPTIQNEQVNTINVDVPRPAAEAPAAPARQTAAVAPQTRSETMFTPAPVETPAAVESRERPKPAPVAGKPANIPGATSYVVAQGDTLPGIAKKVYGAEEGNRFVNIDRIYQANLGVLKSPSLVVVGQKLVIPPLPKGAGTTGPAPTPVPRSATPAEVLPPALFERPKPASTGMTISEKVDALAKRAPAALPAPTPEARMYTVQDGDSLWKIAASQLGAGSRWDEIYKLNTDVLPSQDSSLKVGMRLRLPAK